MSTSNTFQKEHDEGMFVAFHNNHNHQRVVVFVMMILSCATGFMTHGSCSGSFSTCLFILFSGCIKEEKFVIWRDRIYYTVLIAFLHYLYSLLFLPSLLKSLAKVFFYFSFKSQKLFVKEEKRVRKSETHNFLLSSGCVLRRPCVWK